LKRTSLFDIHVSSGALIVPFGGWDMPVQYSGILNEAKAVRSSAGVFDVSHMGLVELTGSNSLDFLNRIVTSDVESMKIGRARYTLICNEQGGVIDDTILYKFDEEDFLLVPNASNTDQIMNWLETWKNKMELSVDINLVTGEKSLIALQGPRAEFILSHLCPLDLSKMKPFNCEKSHIGNSPVIICRTGYTGEDGFEIVALSDASMHLWKELIALGAIPCGLGSRDVLRLEAGLLLHGSDMDSATNPLEAGLERFVSWTKQCFIGMKALQSIKEKGLYRKIVGFKLNQRGVPRHGYRILDGQDQSVGIVTSGTYSQNLEMGIGLGYIAESFSSVGTTIMIDIRGRNALAEIVSTPFYKKQRK
jgi:aminomethyltransferase